MQEPGPVTEDSLKLILRAEFAEFRNKLERHVDERVGSKIGQGEHIELVGRVSTVESRVDDLRIFVNKLAGGLVIVGLLAGFALEVAARRFF